MPEERPKFTAAKKGDVQYSKGLEGIIVGDSTKSYVDGDKGVLIYHGMKIEEVCEHSNFDEICFLLMYDRYPKEDEFERWKRLLAQYRDIPCEVYEFIRSIPKYNIHPMAVMRTAVSMLGLYDDEAEDDSKEAQERKCVRLISRVGTVAAALGRVRRGQEPIHPKKDLGYAANFLYMYLGKLPDKFEEDVFDDMLLLHADHECNASAFSTVVVASSLSDIYSSITGGVASLKGPLHGGANEEVMHMLEEIGSADKAEAFILDAVARKKKVMGFGHRVYKTYDPRAAVLKKYAAEVTKRAGTQKWVEMAEIVEKTMIQKLGQKGIYANVDFYSGIVMASLGIETAMFTPIFAVGRMPGWVSHFMEQMADNRIFRPRFLYVGPLEEHYTPIEKRT